MCICIPPILGNRPAYVSRLKSRCQTALLYVISPGDSRRKQENTFCLSTVGYFFNFVCFLLFLPRSRLVSWGHTLINAPPSPVEGSLQTVPKTMFFPL